MSSTLRTGTLDPMLLPILAAELAAAQELTAVERFSAHEHAPTGRYEALLPASPAGSGERYAFEVDLDACTGCGACVAGCHARNGLDREVGEVWRHVGSVGRQPVTSACHHCVDPGCLKGCPAKAYEVDAATGAVVHLDDACIGCTYCTMTCPYEVPSYNDRLGIVRKCDMCHGRLAAGEAPACVQACPTEAIRIGVVADGWAAARWDLPVGPSPDRTGPTTTYRSTRPLPRRPAQEARPAHGHPALVALLVLSQWAVGAVAAGQAPVALALALVASAASVAHLGRPLLAWRAVLGWRTSWLSREVLAVGAFVPAVAGAVVAPPTRWAAVAAGIAVVACSAMVYAATGRRLWSGRRGGALFGLTSTVALAAVAGAPRAVLVAAVLAKLAVELQPLARRAGEGEVARTGRLLAGPLAPAVGRRLLLAALGVVLPGPLGAACLLAGDLAERALFFTSVSPDEAP